MAAWIVEAEQQRDAALASRPVARKDECDVDLATTKVDLDALLAGDEAALARAMTVLLAGTDEALAAAVGEAARRRSVPVLAITGTGGSGKSSLTDELVRRLRRDSEDKVRVAVVAIDPSRRRSGGRCSVTGSG